MEEENKQPDNKPTYKISQNLFGRPIRDLATAYDPKQTLEAKKLAKKRKESTQAEPQQQALPAVAPVEEIAELIPLTKKAKICNEEELASKLEKANRRAAEAESKLAEKLPVIEKLQSELDASRRDVAANLAQLDEVRAQLTASVKKRDELQLKITNGIALVQQQDERIKTLENEIEEMKRQHTGSLNEIAALRTSLIGAESQISTFHHQLNSASDAESRLMNENAQLRQELEDRAVDLDLAQKRLHEQSHSAITSLLNSPAISDEAIKKRLEAYGSQISQLSKKLDDSDKFELSMRKKLKKCERERDDLAADLKSAKRSLDQLEHSTRELRDELDRSRRNSASAQANSAAFEKLELQKAELERELKREKETRLRAEWDLRNTLDQLEKAKVDLNFERRERSNAEFERNRMSRMLNEERSKPAQPQVGIAEALLLPQLLTLMQTTNQQQLPGLPASQTQPFPPAHPNRRRSTASVEPLPDDYNMPYQPPYSNSPRSSAGPAPPTNPYSTSNHPR